MKPKDSIKIRREMVDMHDKFLSKLDIANDNKDYIGVCWLCYSIFEQRTKRLVEKHITSCLLKRKTKGHEAGIAVKLICIKTLIKNNFHGCGQMNYKVFDDISNWCEDRNKLVHDLVNLKKYRSFDKDFEKLAKRGYPLVYQLYNEIGKYRKWYYKSNKVVDDFPRSENCCSDPKKEYRCIYER